MKIGILNNFAKFGGVHTTTLMLCRAFPEATLILPEDISPPSKFETVANNSVIVFTEEDLVKELKMYDMLIVSSTLGDTTRRMWYNALRKSGTPFYTYLHSYEDIKTSRLHALSIHHLNNCLGVINYRQWDSKSSPLIPESLQFDHCQCYPFDLPEVSDEEKLDKIVMMGRIYSKREIDIVFKVADTMGMEIDLYGELMNITPEDLRGRYIGPYHPSQSVDIMKKYKYFVFPALYHPGFEGTMDWILIEACVARAVPIIYDKFVQPLKDISYTYALGFTSEGVVKGREFHDRSYIVHNNRVQIEDTWTFEHCANNLKAILEQK